MVMNHYPAKIKISDKDGAVFNNDKSGNINSLEVSDRNVQAKLDKIVEQLEILCLCIKEIVGDDEFH